MQKEGLVYFGLIVIFSAIAAFAFPGIFPIDDVSLYLTVTGLIYGLLAAFAISVSWDRHKSIVENLHEEISSEMNAFLLLKHFSDQRVALRYARQIADYAKTVTNVPWNEYFDAENVHKKFRKVFDILGRAKIANEKDKSILEDCFEELRDASTARNQQLVLSNTPLSQGIWGLLLLLSTSVVVGTFVVAFSNSTLGILTKIIMSISSFAILLVIHQIDSLQLAAKEMEEEPNKRLIAFMEEEITNLEFKLGTHHKPAATAKQMKKKR